MQQGCDLRHSQLLPIVEQHGLAVLGRKGEHLPQNLVILRLGVGRRGDLLEQRLAVQPLAVPVQAAVVPADVDRDRGQPGLFTCTRRKAVQPAPRFEHGVLHRVLGQMRIAEQQQTQTVQPVAVCFNQLRQRVLPVVLFHFPRPLSPD